MPIVQKPLADSSRHSRFLLERVERAGSKVAWRGPYDCLRLWLARSRNTGYERATATLLFGVDKRMTDFLSRLVDRAFGHALVVQPLIAPQFAQGAEIFGPDATAFAITETESYRYNDEQ